MLSADRERDSFIEADGLILVLTLSPFVGEYGFLSWSHLRDHVEKLDPNSRPRLIPEPSVEAKFQTICKSRETNDYELWCSVMLTERQDTTT